MNGMSFLQKFKNPLSAKQNIKLRVHIVKMLTIHYEFIKISFRSHSGYSLDIYNPGHKILGNYYSKSANFHENRPTLKVLFS